MHAWQPPTELPDLRRVDIIALDTETNDEGLRADHGSAWPWRGGYICGVSVAWHGESGIRANYFPLRHPESENFECENVSRWLKDLIASSVRIITQNGLYDWGWLRADLGVLMPPSDRIEEIGALATLIDENRFSYGLDALCAWRGLPGKDTTLLREAIKTAGWAPRKRIINVAEHIYKLPSYLVGPYAEADPIATLALYESLNPILDREGTRDAYRLDVDLLPMVHEMRRRGIRIDQSAAEHARDYCLQKRDRALAELSEKLTAPISMDEIRVAEMEGAHIRRARDRIPAHAERQSIVQSRQAGMDGRASALAPAANRDRKQVRRRRQQVPRGPYFGAPGWGARLRRDQSTSLG
jgi:DNA polymerase I-like protein with 3'-5' exonuclease and polymerase domains